MVRTVRMYFLAAALMAGGSVLAAQGSAPAPGGRATAPAPARGAAAKPVPITLAEAAPLLGTWEIPLETPTGRLVASLAFRNEGGKVVAGVSAPRFPEHKITDITKAGQVITLKASAEYSGPLANYEGPVTMVLKLTPKGPTMAAWFDFNDSGFQLGGTATKKP
jgi:hypothetical protein